MSRTNSRNRTPGKKAFRDVITYRPSDRSYSPGTTLPGGDGKPPRAVDTMDWVMLNRKLKDGRHVAGVPVSKIEHDTGKPLFPLITTDRKQLAEEDQQELKKRANNKRRLGIAAVLQRMGRDVSGFDVKSGNPLGDADYATLKKLVTVTDPDKLWGQRRSATFNSLWAEKRMADAKAAAEGRAGVRKAERGDGPITASSGLTEAPVGTSASHGRPQGFWDDRPASRIQRGRVGDAPHYHDRDDSWRYAVNNTRGGAQAVQNRIDRGNWSLTGEGRLAMAMSQYNDRVNRNLARQVEGLNALADAGVDFSKWDDQNSEESV